ncbi:TIGR03943 family protein [Rathayibacter tritici]|uniref:TIGR03943 family protein n=1 Tax=Rathayibacter tritici TaxID=33888 RepID=A0A160KVD3_9MICO|nr:TIGR03943 family protein [Rathayibacter tritici]AND17910.1 TIGR03943 family protein [Rathayibacter tritici]PPF30537.1 TIGR03943 family protein [Rathayibacter tritici]PPF66708.1 TIGR03943 family protein [Rathayibacter tritici]PPG09093.1 TIGR03943 family protein [Rathayibacter tritici]PPI17835.1 TIGR03943 family protein [Rathayibacter tritici]
MRSERLLARWKGVVLSLIGVVSTLWLAATGRLGLYIHPRYFEFSVVLAMIAGVLLIAAFAVVPGADEDAHDVPAHDADVDHLHSSTPSAPWRRVLALAAGVAVIASAAIALLVLPPAALTASTATQREVNTSAVDASVTAAAPTGDTASFSVRDWATLLRQGASEQFLAGRTATVSGFVTPDAADPENVFYIARFVVTCCAVDAQPVGVPVYQAGWADTYTEGQWLEASGGFGANPSVTSAETVVLEPATVTPIDEPAMPYVY